MSAAQRTGVTFLFGRRVRGVTTTRDRVAGVKLASGEAIHSPVVVNACGPASDRLNQLAGVTGDMAVRGRPLRTETHEIPAPPGFRTGRGGVFVTDADLGVAFRPHGQDRLHISSLEPDCDPLEWTDDPWSYRSTPTQHAYDRQTLRVARRLPALRIPPRPCGIGALYDVTPDWRPIFDRSALPGYYLACGTSGNCFKIGPSRRPDCRRHHRRLRIRPRSRPRTRRVRTPPSASNGQARILLTAPDHRADRATQRHSLTTAS